MDIPLTYLYIKTHNVTGLKYFGKTTNSDPYLYPGSGIYWSRHLKLHGNNVTTEIYGSYTTLESLEADAIKFSIDNNIVKSDEWANLVYENGHSGGDTAISFTEESRKKISKRMQGTNNPMAKLNKSQVIEIYHSTEDPSILSKRFSVGTGQIFGIKRKVYYTEVTKDILEMPGFFTGKKIVRIPLPTNAIIDIFLTEETYSYFKSKYGASRQVVTSIKSRKTYKYVTKDLIKAGSVKKYNLTNQDTVDIFNSVLSLDELSAIYGVHKETIRNIKKGKSRKFFKDEF